MDERLAGHAAYEGIDHVGVDDVGELIALLGEALDVLLEGPVGPLSIVVEVPLVPGSSVRTLKGTDKDRMEVAPVADAARLELPEPSSGLAQQK